MQLLSISSSELGKIVRLRKSVQSVRIIHEVLRDLGMVRDERRQVLQHEARTGTFLTDAFYTSYSKRSNIAVAVFVGSESIIMHVIYVPESSRYVARSLERLSAGSEDDVRT